MVTSCHHSSAYFARNSKRTPNNPMTTPTAGATQDRLDGDDDDGDGDDGDEFNEPASRVAPPSSPSRRTTAVFTSP